MPIGTDIQNFFNGLCCAGNPCAGFTPHTSASIVGTMISLTGGNSLGVTDWEIIQDGSVLDSGVILDGGNTFSFPEYDEEQCYTVRWKGACENTWHEAMIGDCADPCAGKQGYTSVTIYSSFAEFSGGTGDLETQYQVIQNGVTILDRTLPPGQNLIDDVLPVAENICFTLRWKSPCETEWHEAQSVACASCASYQPHTTATLNGQEVTLSGGANGTLTEWQIWDELGENLLVDGTMAAGVTSFTWDGFEAGNCYLVAWKNDCEDTWHEGMVGDCADPCAGYEPFTDFDYTGEVITLTGGNAIGTTQWERLVNGDLINDGTLAAGEDSFTIPGFDPEQCQTIRFKGACEDEWHEFTIGDCTPTPAYLDANNYFMDYGAVTGVCNIELSVGRLPEARDAAITDGVRIKCNWTAYNDNGVSPCSVSGETIFEVSDIVIDLGTHDVSCGGISACSMMGSFTINSLEIVP